MLWKLPLVSLELLSWLWCSQPPDYLQPTHWGIGQFGNEDEGREREKLDTVQVLFNNGKKSLVCFKQEFKAQNTMGCYEII